MDMNCSPSGGDVRPESTYLVQQTGVPSVLRPQWGLSVLIDAKRSPSGGDCGVGSKPPTVRQL